jgi:hypothetical protein
MAKEPPVTGDPASGPAWSLPLQLARRAAAGDDSAVEDLQSLSAAHHERFNKSNDSSGFHTMYPAFELLGYEAAEGNEQAFRALLDALSRTYLKGHACRGLGIAAGAGHPEALRILLNPDDSAHVLRSSAVFELHTAAENGNRDAIAFLIRIAHDPKAKPLWHGAVDGLRRAAAAGQEAAIDALVELSTSNPARRSEMVLGLRAAAIEGSEKAADALRGLNESVPEAIAFCTPANPAISPRRDKASWARRPAPPDESEAAATLRWTRQAVGLAMAIADGDLDSLGDLDRLASRVYQPAYRSGEQRPEVIEAAFNLLGSEAGGGNEHALRALVRSLHRRHLSAFAPEGLSLAAQQGNPAALQAITSMDWSGRDAQGLIRRMKEPAERGDGTAIDLLAQIAGQPQLKPLRHLASSPIATAAERGHGYAVDVLIELGRNDKGYRPDVLRGLRAAAGQGHERAATALKEMETGPNAAGERIMPKSPKSAPTTSPAQLPSSGTPVEG